MPSVQKDSTKSAGKERLDSLQDESKKKSEVIAQQKKKSLELADELTRLEHDLDDVNQSLDYGTLTGLGSLLWDNLVGIADQEPDTDLRIIPNKQLSRADLERKHTLIFVKMQEIQETRNALQAEIAVLEQGLEESMKTYNDENAMYNAFEGRELYLQNPQEFWDKVLLRNIVLSAHPAEVYDSTDKIMAICDLFDQDTDFASLTRAWTIVSQARDISTAQNSVQFLYGEPVDAQTKRQLVRYAQKYQEAANKFFEIYADHLPVELQALKVLYRNDPESIDPYLSLLEGIQGNKNYDPNNPDKTIEKIPMYSKMITSLNNDLQAVYRAKAMTELSRIRGFTDLTKVVQEQLADQQLYVDKLLFDLDSVPAEFRQAKLQEIDALAEKLKNNISNAVINHTAPDVNGVEFAKIKKQIDDREFEIRAKIFKDNFQSDISKLGAGAGIGWLIGGSTLMSAVAAAGLAKAATYAVSSEIPAITEEREFAASIAPTDYTFLRLQDEFFGIDTDTPIEQMEVKGPAFITNAQERIQAKVEAKVQDLINKNLDPEGVQKQIDQSFQKWNQTLGIIGATVISVAVISVIGLAIAVPPLWPLSVAVVVGLTLGFGGLVVRDVMRNNTPLREAIKTVAGTFASGFRSIAQVITRPFRPSGIPVAKLTIVDEAKAQNEFKLDPAQMRALEEYAPGYAKPLMAYFNSRLEDMQHKVQKAQETDPQTGYLVYNLPLIDEVQLEFNQLNTAWQELTQLIHNPKSFCAYMDDYLSTAYGTARNIFIRMAQEQQTAAKNKVAYDMDKEKAAPLTFSQQQPDFEMNFARDFKHERSNLEQLHALKEKLGEIKQKL